MIVVIVHPSDWIPAATSLVPSLVTVTGLAGLACGTFSTLLQGRRAILAAQAAAAGFFTLHFLLLGSLTAAAMCLLGLVQLACCSREESDFRRDALFCATLPAALVLAGATWQGPGSALSLAGFLLSSLGRRQSCPRRMRLLFLAGTLAGGMQNLLTGASFGLVSDLLALSGHLWSLGLPALVLSRIRRSAPARRIRTAIGGQRFASAAEVVSLRSR